MQERKYMSKMLLLILFVITSYSGISEEIEEYYQQAMELIKEREFEKAHNYLDSIYKLTNNEIFFYERAVIYYRQKDFSSAIDVLTKILILGNPRVEYYQLLGSCYDFEGEKTKAVNILNEGLYKFPEAGELYYELGVTKLGKQERTEAADLWEKGIFMDPTYDRNYYQLAKFYKSTDFKVVSLLYGEIYINISFDDSKKQEMSGILYNIYENVFNTYKTEGQLEFTRYNKDFTIEEAVEFPFLFKYHEIASEAIKNINTKSEISISMMNEFRTEFIKLWLEKEIDIFYPNLVFDFHSQLKDLNHFEAYNYMLLSAGDIDEIKDYAMKNKEKVSSLINWQSKNQLTITNENKYFSQKYKP